MKIKKPIIVLMILLSSHVHAQKVSFQTFLSEHKEVEKLDSTSFGSPYEFIESESLYSEFLPTINDDCHCKQKGIRWQKGSYIEYKNFIAVALRRYCSDYLDGNDEWFMENEGFDYMLITYSRDGKMIDCKTLCHSGTAAYAIGIKASDDGQGLAVEQRTLNDCNPLVQYKNLEYTSCTRKYTLLSDGKIKESITIAPHKETVDVLSSVEQFSFEQFKAYFNKQDKPVIDHTLFSQSRGDAELPFESCLSLIPDTLDHNCWPRDICWTPCQYMEHEDLISFFIIKDCRTPKVGFLPYTDYMVLEFHKDGTFKGARNIYHWDDDSVADEATINNLITKALKNIYATKAEQIKFFYDSYMECIEMGERDKESDLLDKFLTPEMLDKRGRLVDATGSDPLLRAQDVLKHNRQSLTCRHLEGNWFEVAYRTFDWDAKDTVTIRIPVRAEEDKKGMVRINYITPYWGGSRYGDYLFDIPSQKVRDRLDARTFVETFFKAYTYSYAIMSTSLEEDLEQLRKRYCTSSMQEKYATLKQQFLEDECYKDPLIDCADFDAFWYPTISVASIDSITFLISYDLGVKGWRNDIKVTVTREKERFRLSDIEVE
jgi:hypothetical protein